MGNRQHGGYGDSVDGRRSRCLRAGAHVVTPSLYSLDDPRSAPRAWVDRLTAAAEEGGSTLLVSGVDPGWANDALAVMAAGLCTRIKTIHCQEIFDHSTYDQPHAVRVSCGFGGPMDEVPMMLLPSVPTRASATTASTSTAIPS